MFCVCAAHPPPPPLTPFPALLISSWLISTLTTRVAQPPRRERGEEDDARGAAAGDASVEAKDDDKQKHEEEEEEEEASSERRGRGSQQRSSVPAPSPGGWMTAHNASSSQKNKRPGGGRVRRAGSAGVDTEREVEEEDDDGEERARLATPADPAVTVMCRQGLGFVPCCCFGCCWLYMVSSLSLLRRMLSSSQTRNDAQVLRWVTACCRKNSSFTSTRVRGLFVSIAGIQNGVRSQSFAPVGLRGCSFYIFVERWVHAKFFVAPRGSVVDPFELGLPRHAVKGVPLTLFPSTKVYERDWLPHEHPHTHTRTSFPHPSYCSAFCSFVWVLGSLVLRCYVL